MAIIKVLILQILGAIKDFHKRYYIHLEMVQIQGSLCQMGVIVS